METLCCSFWFWFVTSTLVVVAVVSAFFTGLFLGREVGGRQNEAQWIAMIQRQAGKKSCGL